MKYIYQTKRGLVVQVPGLDGKVRTRRVKTLEEGKRVRTALLRGLKVTAMTRANRRAAKRATLCCAVTAAALHWNRNFHVGIYESTGEATEALRFACRKLEKFEEGK